MFRTITMAYTLIPHRASEPSDLLTRTSILIIYMRCDRHSEGPQKSLRKGILLTDVTSGNEFESTHHEVPDGRPPDYDSVRAIKLALTPAVYLHFLSRFGSSASRVATERRLRTN